MHATDPGLEGTTTLREPTPEEIITSLRNEVAGLRHTVERQTLNLSTVRDERDNLTRHLEGLGEAILEKAEAHNLTCEEYDAFADEWNLPKMKKGWQVTITLTVEARDEEGAIEFVKENVSLRDYSEGVYSGPEFEAEEALS